MATIFNITDFQRSTIGKLDMERTALDDQIFNAESGEQLDELCPRLAAIERTICNTSPRDAKDGRIQLALALRLYRIEGREGDALAAIAQADTKLDGEAAGALAWLVWGDRKRVRHVAS